MMRPDGSSTISVLEGMDFVYPVKKSVIERNIILDARSTWSSLHKSTQVHEEDDIWMHAKVTCKLQSITSGCNGSNFGTGSSGAVNIWMISGQQFQKDENRNRNQSHRFQFRNRQFWSGSDSKNSYPLPMLTLKEITTLLPPPLDTCYQVSFRNSYTFSHNVCYFVTLLKFYNHSNRSHSENSLTQD